VSVGFDSESARRNGVDGEAVEDLSEVDRVVGRFGQLFLDEVHHFVGHSLHGINHGLIIIKISEKGN